MKRFGFIFTIAAMLVMAFAGPVSADVDISATYFKDVPNSAWYYDYVYELVDRGVIAGYEDSTFRPNKNITRAEIAKIIACITDENTKIYDGYSEFSDCRGHWADEYINWAAEKGIVNGVGSDKFDPDAPITREALCTMVMRYAKYEAFYPQKIVEPAGFSDDNNISSWARDSVYHMQQAGIINGKGNNLFDPQGKATRAECAKIFCVYLSCNNDFNAQLVIDDLNWLHHYYGSVCSYFLADYTHDGYEDLIVIEPISYGAAIYVYTGLGGEVACIYHDEVYPIAENESYYLYQNAYGAYLIRYLHDSATGQTEQGFYMFCGDNIGTTTYIYDNYVSYYMDGSYLDIGVPRTYYTDKSLFSSYKNKSTFLFGSIWQEMSYNSHSFEKAVGNWGKW